MNQMTACPGTQIKLACAALTQSRLKELLHYDAATGVFTRISSNSNRYKSGGIAGWLSNHGYITIVVDGKRYQAHRLAFLYMTGCFPMNFVDHINTIKNDNRFSNLREATRSENQRNCGARSHNKSGLKGVYFFEERNKWVAYINLSGKKKHLGVFDSPDHASAAYQAAAKQHHGEFYYSQGGSK